MVENIARHHVDRALDTDEAAAKRTRHSAQQGRLSDPDIAFDQDMAARKNANRHKADDARLPDDSLFDFALEFQRARAPRVEPSQVIEVIFQETLP
ncbi:hypothetical protein LMG27198_46120 [Methylocystis echinoides]|uniref:Uncharacterized protein n=1 Tax=Methylocystis echinoides TaxID=29468 RepID=A0A9W6GZC1_9HYPH|nr:hypothetical protein LMG27198_46120 [Methylocystis echinoides]